MDVEFGKLEYEQSCETHIYCLIGNLNNLVLGIEDIALRSRLLLFNELITFANNDIFTSMTGQ